MASSLARSYILTPRALAAALPNRSIVPLCATWYLPNDAQQRTGLSSFVQSRIPGALFFDLDAVCDVSPYPHMFPPAPVFVNAMRELGVKRDDTLVVYDGDLGVFSAPRVAWMLRVFGHEKICLLDSYKLWREEGRESESGRGLTKRRRSGEVYPDVEPDLGMLVGFEEMLELARAARRGESTRKIIIDARPAGRFSGVEPEPRPGLSSGHIPGALNVPFSSMLTPTKNFKGKEEIRRTLKSAGVDVEGEEEKILMCGTGVTAVVVETAMRIAEVKGKLRVYDGSWTEWAMRVPAEVEEEGEEGLVVKD